MADKCNDKPCNQCPYRKESLPGFLGDANYQPELFLQQLDMKEMHPCHLAIKDWENYTKEELLAANKCTGALQFMNNSLRIHRNPKIAALQKTAGKNEKVFQWKSEFIEHHKERD